MLAQAEVLSPAEARRRYLEARNRLHYGGRHLGKLEEVRLVTRTRLMSDPKPKLRDRPAADHSGGPVESIMFRIATECGTIPHQLRGTSRVSAIDTARMEVVYTLMDHGYTWEEIGEALRREPRTVQTRVWRVNRDEHRAKLAVLHAKARKRLATSP